MKTKKTKKKQKRKKRKQKVKGRRGRRAAVAVVRGLVFNCQICCAPEVSSTQYINFKNHGEPGDGRRSWSDFGYRVGRGVVMIPI